LPAAQDIGDKEKKSRDSSFVLKEKQFRIKRRKIK